MPTWLTAKQAQEHLQVSKTTFYKLIKKGHITGHTFPGMDSARYAREDLDALMTPTPKKDEGER